MAWDQARRLGVVAAAAVVGAGMGWVVGGARLAAYNHDPGNALPFLSQTFPLPHHVPAQADGVSFRFAMVHDVLVERYLRHDPAYYQARAVADRARLAHLPVDSPEHFAATDDLGVDLERLGQHDEAIALMRAKLAAQERAGLTGRALYTTYADLGTFLIHSSLGPALGGDAAARTRFNEGVAFIRQSVAVNPDAHFGRERWQASIASFLGAAIDDPELLTTFDCLGNRLDLSVEAILNRELNWVDLGYGRPRTPQLGQSRGISEVPAYFEPGTNLGDPARWAALAPIRQFITRVGAEHGWEALGDRVPDHRAPVAFDEPMLGIIGMWRQGGGANPHFALAIGETMVRVGQRRIAWDAFERAARLADRFSPRVEIRDRLRDHCRARQAAIVLTLNHPPTPRGTRPPWQEISPPRPDDSPEQLRARFDAELRFGQSEQARHEAWERARLASGAAVDAPNFATGYDPGPTPLASRPGPEEQFATVTRAAVAAYRPGYQRAMTVMGAGVAAFLAAAIGRVRLLLRSRPGSSLPSSAAMARAATLAHESASYRGALLGLPPLGDDADANSTKNRAGER